MRGRWAQGFSEWARGAEGGSLLELWGHSRACWRAQLGNVDPAGPGARPVPQPRASASLWAPLAASWLAVKPVAALVPPHRLLPGERLRDSVLLSELASEGSAPGAPLPPPRVGD